MGEFDHRLDQTGETDDAVDPRKMEQILKSVTQDLRSLQQDLVSQLSHEVGRLQAEKSRLLNEIEKLQAQQQVLQSEQQVLLNQQQIAQQRLWAKQLAQALANHLYSLLTQRLTQAGPLATEASPTLIPSGHDTPTLLPQAAEQLQTLDSVLRQTLSSLQSDLASHESSLTQQLSRMQNLEQQGEALLEALVSRLNQRLQTESARPAGQEVRPITTHAPAGSVSGTPNLPQFPNRSAISAATPPTPPASASPPAPENVSSRSVRGLGSFSTSQPSVSGPVERPTASPPQTSVAPAIAPPSRATPPSSFGVLSSAQVGLLFILLSTLALSLHNVVVGIVGGPTSIFGIFNLGHFITLDSFSDSLLILWLRMLVVVPVMLLIAKSLYPPVWHDVRQFFLSKDRKLMWMVIGSGSFLFGSQVFIYLAIAATSPGVAVTILFMYPLLTVPLAWFLFGDRPTLLRVGVMLAILLGVILTAFPRLTATTNISASGIFAAVLSGVLFALYLVSMQISFRKLHPVPVSFIQFVTIFVLTNIMLLPFGVQEPPKNLVGLLIGGLFLGTLTLIGYLFNNLGVKLMGAARASIVASSGPALTALLAFLITPSDRTALQTVQIFGILLVTTAVIALSFEKMLTQSKFTKRT